jgi:LmbE family N-acetylglucosaminyl deacetylase
MLSLVLGRKRQPLRRILCLGAHCDDIEIGCGGTILRLLSINSLLEVDWIVFSSNAIRKREALRSADLFLKSRCTSRVRIHRFRDGFFPSEHKQIKECFERMKKRASPDLIFTHRGNDLHQDHRIICELTWNTFRDHLILEYETPKYDGDLGAPNVFVGLDEATCSRKIRHILEAFSSQAQKLWFTEDTFRAVLRLRGVESGSREKWAEGFYCRKAVLEWL